MSCKGTCKADYETANILSWRKDVRYWPKCRTCGLKINIQSAICPCCNRKLSRRVKYRSSKIRAKYVPALVQWSRRK